MIESRSKHTLWVERYRPQTIQECILPKVTKSLFQAFVDNQEIPTLLLSGSAGIGKTTVAKALCNELDAEMLFINGSVEGRNIDCLRGSVLGFASSCSLTDQKKIILFDEFDFANPQSVMPGLRALIEEFSNNARFIFTCNHLNKIIPAIQSRCTVIDFSINKKEKAKLAGDFFKRATQILTQEGIEFDPKVVAEIITKHFPDFRKVLMELQRYSVSGKIDSGILVNLSDDSYSDLFRLMKDKNWKETRSWVALNSEVDITILFRKLYDGAFAIIEPSSVPSLVTILGDYSYRSAFVADQEIMVMCALTEIMSVCVFK